MRLVFAGTPPFAARALEALVAAGHDIPLVLTQPDRPAGRGLKLTPSAVAQAATNRGLVLSKPSSLKAPEAQEVIREAGAEAMVVAAYGLLLPKAVLGIPPRGCLNIHASILPRWRGAAPIHRAILAGDSTTGISIMQMDEGLDTGPTLLIEEIAIAPRETTGLLHDRLAELGARCIVAAIEALDRLQPRPQDSSRAVYAPKVTKAECRIDWRETAEAIDRRVRAFDPAPGAEAAIDGETIKIWKAEPVAGSGTPGSLLEVKPAGLVVACGQGALCVQEVQRPGGRRMAVADMLRGRLLPARAAFS